MWQTIEGLRYNKFATYALKIEVHIYNIQPVF